MLGGQLGDEVGGQRGRVGERLVEGLDQARQELRGVRAQHQLVVVGVEPLRHHPRPVELVERALLEPDRERPHPLVAGLRRQRGQRRGVDAAGEEHPHRHVGEQVGADGVEQPLAQLGGQLARGLPADVGRGGGSRPGIALDPGVGAGLPGQQVAGGQLASGAEDRQRGGDRVERQEGVERVQVDLPGKARVAQQRLELRGEGQRAGVRPPVQRLDPVRVPGQHQPAAGGVPHGDREHASQPLDEARAPLLVEVDQHLRVAAGDEPVAAGEQLLAQLAVVVDLPVLDHVDRAVLVGDRLVAARHVDDRQPPRGQAHRARDHRALVVGAAVDQRRVHRLKQRPVDRTGSVQGGEPADPAHAPGATPARRAARPAPGPAW